MSRLTIEVSRARLSDLDDVLALWAEGRDAIVRQGRTSPTAEQMRPRLAQAIQTAAAEIVLARRDGRPSGFIILREPPLTFLSSDQPALCIEQLYVASGERRHGVARAMLSYVAGRAERGACEQILTSVAPWARESHRFFARLGFVPMTVHRSVTPALLRRRLAGESNRGALDDLISRRRSLRARAKQQAAAYRPVPLVDGPMTGEQPRLA